MSEASTSEPDPRTLARFRDGDITALSTIFRLYGPKIRRLAGRMMANQADADDATQEIFVRAFEQAHRFHGRSALFTWLYRLAVRHCLNRIRQRKRSRAHEHAASAEPLQARPGSVVSPLDHVSDQEQSQVLNRLLQSLPAPYRACLVLREVEGFSYAQIAELLEIPVGTVMSRLARARWLLRARLLGSDQNRVAVGNNVHTPVVQTLQEHASDDLC